MFGHCTPEPAARVMGDCAGDTAARLPSRHATHPREHRARVDCSTPYSWGCGSEQCSAKAESIKVKASMSLSGSDPICSHTPRTRPLRSLSWRRWASSSRSASCSTARIHHGMTLVTHGRLTAGAPVDGRDCMRHATQLGLYRLLLGFLLQCVRVL